MIVALAENLTQLGLVALVVIWWWARHRDVHPATSALVRWLGATTVLAISAISAFNVLVDPNARYGLHLIEPIKTSDPVTILNTLQAMQTQPDMLVIGTSRTRQIDASFASGLMDMDIQVLTLAGATLSELKAILDAYLSQQGTLPPVLMLELNSPTVVSLAGNIDRHPIGMLPYFDTAQRADLVRSLLNEPLKLATFRESVQSIAYHFTSWRPFGDGLIETDAQLHARIDDYVAQRAAVGATEQNYPLRFCTAFNDTLIPALDTIRQVTEEHNTSLVLFVMPFNPYYYAVYLSQRAGQLACFADYDTHLSTYAATHPGVWYVTLRQPEDIVDIQGAAYFTDDVHTRATATPWLFDDHRRA